MRPVSGHRDIPDEVVARAQLYDYEHFWGDRQAYGTPGGQWGAVPPDQVRRLLWGAYGGAVPVAVEDEPRPAAFLDEHDLAATGMYEDRGEGA
jgi:hypothetical protein